VLPKAPSIVVAVHVRRVSSPLAFEAVAVPWFGLGKAPRTRSPILHPRLRVSGRQLAFD